MTNVSSRDLRNHTAEVLRQVAAGARVTITVKGKAVAEIVPVGAARSQFFTRAELAAVLSHHHADSGLSRDLELLAADTSEFDPSRPRG